MRQPSHQVLHRKERSAEFDSEALVLTKQGAPTSPSFSYLSAADTVAMPHTLRDLRRLGRSPVRLVACFAILAGGGTLPACGASLGAGRRTSSAERRREITCKAFQISSCHDNLDRSLCSSNLQSTSSQEPSCKAKRCSSRHWLLELLTWTYEVIHRRVHGAC